MNTVYRENTSFEYTAGICNYRKHVVYDGNDRQESIARLRVNVTFDDNKTTVPISKITQCVSEHPITLRTAWSLEELIDKIYDIHASDISIYIRMPLSFACTSLCSGIESRIVYDTVFGLEYIQGKLIPHLGCTLPLVTVCPCSLASSAPFAHMQRMYCSFCLHSDTSLLLEDILPIVETCASEKTYPIIKQVDEKEILRNAYNHASFAEDVIKRMASSLHNTTSIEGFMVSVQSFESLHPHDIIACVAHNYTAFHSTRDIKTTEQ